MKKIYIVSEKNIEKNIYETKTIVIFNDNNVPKIINYEGAKDLIPVVEIARENGFDFLVNEDIRRALDSKMIEVISNENSKEMSMLKAKLLEENLKYMDNKIDKVEPIKEAEQVIENEDGIINSKTTMFKPVNGNIPLPVEEREYIEYLKLNSLRSQNRIDKDGLKKIDQMTKYNDIVASLENARNNVISQEEKVKVLYRFNRTEAEKARVELERLQKKYEALSENYRKQLTGAIKEFVGVNNSEKTATPEIIEEKTVVPVVEEVKEEETIVPVVEEVKEEKTIVPVIEEAKEEKTEEPVIEEVKEEKTVVPVVEEVKEEKTEEPVVEEAKEEKPEEPVIEEAKEEKPEEPVIEEVKEEIDNYKPNFVLVPNDTTKEKEAKGVHPETSEVRELRVKKPDGNEEIIEVRETSKLKKFLKRVGALIINAALLVGGYFGIVKPLIEKNQNRNNVKQNIERNHVVGNEAFVSPTSNIKEEPMVKPTVEPTVEPTAESTVEPTVKPTSEPTVKPTSEPTVVPKINLDLEISNYCKQYNVPESTRLFLNQGEVREFLSKINNVEQLKEAISALCYGYEANILMTKDGNFRMTEDGETYLTAFTHDFLCAKVVVNRYDARQMLNVFGGANITYEEIMQGFQSYTHTVRTYGMNAIDPLPFHYLTNNDYEATMMLNDLQEKLIAVNINRNNNTLTSKHTDDFIEEVFDTYVLNDESLKVSEGAKTVGASLVSSYILTQGFVSNGEPLYLHEDRGLARAGISLAEVDGHFDFEYPDKTHFEYTSLVDVMNHGYGDVNETAHRCLSEQEQLLASINKMQDLVNVDVNNAKANLEVALYREGMNDYATRLQSDDTSELFDEILSENPLLSDVVLEYKDAKENSENEYLSFNELTNNIDRLLGIKNRKSNDYATLINNRIESATLYNSYNVTSGKRYTKSKGKYDGRGFGKSFDKSGSETVTRTTTTTTTTEQVDYDDLTPEEKIEVQEQIEDLQEQEEAEREEHQETITETVEDLREAVEQGASDEELERIADQAGIDLNPDYREEMTAALEEQHQGEEKRENIEQSVENHNVDAEKDSETRRQQDEERQNEERRQEDELIAQSMSIVEGEKSTETHQETQKEESKPEVKETPETHKEESKPETEKVPETPEEESKPVLDQHDPDRTEEDEEVYIPDDITGRNIETLKQLKALALAMDVSVDDLDLFEGNPKTKTLS